MLAGFVKYLPSVRMDCTVTRFAVSCSRCAASRDLLRFGWLLSDSVKCKGASCVQGIKYAAPNRQKRKKLCAAFNTQHRAFLCCRFLITQHRGCSCHALCKGVINQALEANDEIVVFVERIDIFRCREDADVVFPQVVDKQGSLRSVSTQAG